MTFTCCQGSSPPPTPSPGRRRTRRRTPRRRQDFLRARADWLVVDHYGLERRWENEMREHAGRLMVIDDLADRAHDCDLLLDQNDLWNPTRYDALVPAHCQKLLGPAYALLRDEFRTARERWPREVGETTRIFVFFGGTDPTNETPKALRALRRWGEGKTLDIDVVIGGGNPHRAEVEGLVNATPNALLHVQAGNMAELMARADLSVGAGGSTTWERFCLGLPSLVVTTATNQEAIARALAKDDYHLLLGNHTNVDEDVIVRGLDQLTPAQRRLFARRGGSLVDGRGACRVVEYLREV